MVLFPSCRAAIASERDNVPNELCSPSHQADHSRAPEQSSLLHTVYSPETLNFEPNSVIGAFLYRFPSKMGMEEWLAQNNYTASAESAASFARESPPRVGERDLHPRGTEITRI